MVMAAAPTIVDRVVTLVVVVEQTVQAAPVEGVAATGSAPVVMIARNVGARDVVGRIADLPVVASEIPVTARVEAGVTTAETVPVGSGRAMTVRVKDAKAGRTADHAKAHVRPVEVVALAATRVMSEATLAANVATTADHAESTRIVETMSAGRGVGNVRISAETVEVRVTSDVSSQTTVEVRATGSVVIGAMTVVRAETPVGPAT